MGGKKKSKPAEFGLHIISMLGLDVYVNEYNKFIFIPDSH